MNVFYFKALLLLCGFSNVFTSKTANCTLNEGINREIETLSKFNNHAYAWNVIAKGCCKYPGYLYIQSSDEGCVKSCRKFPIEMRNSAIAFIGKMDKLNKLFGEDGDRAAEYCWKHMLSPLHCHQNTSNIWNVFDKCEKQLTDSKNEGLEMKAEVDRLNDDLIPENAKKSVRMLEDMLRNYIFSGNSSALDGFQQLFYRSPAGTIAARTSVLCVCDILFDPSYYAIYSLRQQKYTTYYDRSIPISSNATEFSPLKLIIAMNPANFNIEEDSWEINVNAISFNVTTKWIFSNGTENINCSLEAHFRREDYFKEEPKILSVHLTCPYCHFNNATYCLTQIGNHTSLPQTSSQDFFMHNAYPLVMSPEGYYRIEDYVKKVRSQPVPRYILRQRKHYEYVDGKLVVYDIRPRNPFLPPPSDYFLTNSRIYDPFTGERWGTV